MSKYLELFAKAIGMGKPMERSRFELETNKNTKTEDGGETTLRQLDSTSTTSSEEEKASTAKS